jgi:hypothetical protein
VCGSFLLHLCQSQQPNLWTGVLPVKRTMKNNKIFSVSR